MAEWLRANGLLGAGPQGTSPGILRPGAPKAIIKPPTRPSGGSARIGHLPSVGGRAPQGPIPGGPSYYHQTWVVLQVPTAGEQPTTTDLSAAPRKPLPVQQLPSGAMPAGAVNPDQVLPPPTAREAPGMFGRLQAGASNFTTGGNPIAGLLNAIQGLATGTRTDPTGIAMAQQQ